MNGSTALRHIDEIESRLIRIERKIGELRAWQAVLVNELDKMHAHRSDASRTMTEWLQSHLDVSRDTARALSVAGRKCTGEGAAIQADLADRDTFDRAVATHRLMDTGLDADRARGTRHMNLEDVRKMTGKRRRTGPVDEQRAFEERYLKLQPTLDESAWTVSGRLSGAMGAIVDKALSSSADALRRLPSGETASRAQRQADALVMALQESPIGKAEHEGSHASAEAATHATVFVDARTTDSDSHTATIPFGPTIGPNVLEGILCNGTVRVVGMDADRPVAATSATRAIPPAIRDSILLRDDGCTVDGCSSRYRLEPHHVQRWSEGGTHDPDNLTTLCWYHHHVAIHGRGFRIDPESPANRRRLLPPGRHRRPPTAREASQDDARPAQAPALATVP